MLDRKFWRGLNGGGTLGPFVNIHGHPGFLTCGHVLFDINQIPLRYDNTTSSTRVDVVQPAAGTYAYAQPGNILKEAADRPCGFVQRAVFNPDATSSVSIDAAVVAISNPNRVPTKGEFAIKHTCNLQKEGFIFYFFNVS